MSKWVKPEKNDKSCDGAVARNSRDSREFSKASEIYEICVFLHSDPVITGLDLRTCFSRIIFHSTKLSRAASTFFLRFLTHSRCNIFTAKLQVVPFKRGNTMQKAIIDGYNARVWDSDNYGQRCNAAQGSRAAINFMRNSNPCVYAGIWSGIWLKRSCQRRINSEREASKNKAINCYQVTSRVFTTFGSTKFVRPRDVTGIFSLCLFAIL